MLRRVSALVTAFIISCAVHLPCQTSVADGCPAAGTQVSVGYTDDTIGLHMSSCSYSPGSPASSGSQSQGSQPGPSQPQGSEAAAVAPSGCHNRQGEKVACWYGDLWWSPAQNLWCKQADARYRESYDATHKNPDGSFSGTLYRCRGLVYHWFSDEVVIWEPDSAPPEQPSDSRPAVDAEFVVKRAMASLELHPPTVGVSAYVYPGYEDWGLSWWVGAPMWLWVNPYDPLQWGTHTLNVEEGGASVTATVTATKASYDPGDGSPSVVCANPGTSRRFSSNDLLRNHSPSGCEHTYVQTNKLGDKNSRYKVSATVTWVVDCSATNGQSGSFTADVASTEPTAIHVGEIYIVNVYK